MTTPQTGLPEGLKIGDHVPDFTLQAGMGENHTLSDYQQRRNIVLVFYVLDFTGGCESELGALELNIGEIHARGGQVLSVSCDAAPSHRAFSEKLGGISFPMLTDFHPHGKVSELYSVYNAQRGVPIRSVFIIDKEGVLRWQKTFQPGDSMEDVSDILEELDKLK